MPNNPVFVKTEEVVAFNRLTLSTTTETHCILDKGRLISAVARPINKYEYGGITDICQLSGALIFGLAKAHAFEQGNKRTAFKAGLYFIEINGYGYHGATNGMNLGLKIIELCENAASEEQLVEFLRSNFIFEMNKSRFVSAVLNPFRRKT